MKEEWIKHFMEGKKASVRIMWIRLRLGTGKGGLCGYDRGMRKRRNGE